MTETTSKKSLVRDILPKSSSNRSITKRDGPIPSLASVVVGKEEAGKNMSKKSLVRDIKPKRDSSKSITLKKHIPSLATIVIDKPDRCTKVPEDLGIPKMNSTKHVARCVKFVEELQPAKVKSTLDLDKQERLVLDEKITKHMNFPYDQIVFKDLLPLCTRSSAPPVLISREPAVQKDMEPSLSDFLKPVPRSEYTYEIKSKEADWTSVQQFNGLRLTKIMKTWN